MSIQINKSAYEKLIKEDIEWLLSNTKDSLERRHIVEVLNYSPERLYANGSSEIPKDLEEAAKKYAVDNTWIDEFTNDGEVPEWYEHTADVFKAGASWQKEQMMKEAVEGTVYGNGEYTWVAGDIPSNFKYGDKVRIIICKKED